MQPMLIVSYLHWTVVAFVVVLLAAMAWLKLETRRFNRARMAVSRRVGFESEAETFFTMDTKSQITNHAACRRPIQHPFQGPRSSKDQAPIEGKDRPGQRLPMPVDMFVRDLNDLLRDQGSH